jgi:hypothetical protein
VALGRQLTARNVTDHHRIRLVRQSSGQSKIHLPILDPHHIAGFRHFPPHLHSIQFDDPSHVTDPTPAANRRQQVEALSKIPSKTNVFSRIDAVALCQYETEMPTTKKTASKKTTAKRNSSKRELINTGTDKRFVRRRGDGTFKESDDVGKSLAADRRQHAKTKSKPGQGDKGDR